MAKYTIELRTLMNDTDVMPLITKALSTYPMYVPENTLAREVIPTREELNQKLLNHYKWYEIGFETIARFLDELEIAMNEIMPYFMQRYKSVETMYVIDDIFGNIDIEETFREERTGTSTANNVANSTNSSTGTSTASASDSSETHSATSSLDKNVESETPQGNISKTASAIDDVTHADKVTWNKASGETDGSSSGASSSTANTTNEGESSVTSESTSNDNQVVEHTYHKKGNQGVNTYAHDMIEFRDTIIDVTMEIIEHRKLKELFMQVF